MSGVRAQRNYDEPQVSIVIPAKNEAKNLEHVLPEIPDVHEVILVDGYSVDDTVIVAGRMRPGIRIVQQTRRGKGNALVCGFEATTGDIIVMFDADGSADPAEIPRFVEALLAGADFAKGSRFQPGGGSHDITRFRSLGNKGLNLLANMVMGTHYTDLCYGYNAFWTDILDQLNLPSPSATAGSSSGMIWGDGFEIETVLNCRIALARLVVTEVASVERSRIYGVSNLNAVSDGIRVLKTILKERDVERWFLAREARRNHMRKVSARAGNKMRLTNSGYSEGRHRAGPQDKFRERDDGRFRVNCQG